MTDRTFILLGAIATMASAFDKLSDWCYTANGKWWQGTDCGGTHVGRTDCWCASCIPCETSQLKIDGVDWNAKCSIGRSDARVNAPAWPKFKYDTAFSRSDPNRDQEWVQQITVAAQEESDNVYAEVTSWAFAATADFFGMNPILAIIPFAVEKTMEYMKVGEEDDDDQLIDLDLADTVDRIMEMTADLDDQNILAEALTGVKLAMRDAHDKLQFIKNDVSIKSSLEKVVLNENTLNTKYVQTFGNLELLETRPEAAWYLYEPMFALMDQQFQHVLLKYALKWAQASGAKRHDDPAGKYPELVAQEDRETECEHLDEYLNGPLLGGQRQIENSGSLIYKWNLFVEYFEMAWEARVDAISNNMKVTRSVKNKAEKWDFSNDWCGGGFGSKNRANHVAFNQQGCKWAELESDLSSKFLWEDNWQWGASKRSAASYETTWGASTDFEYCHHGFGAQYNAALCCNKCSSHINRWAGPIKNGGKCSMSYNGQNLGDAYGPGNYRHEAEQKKKEVFAKYEAAYNAMRRTLEKQIFSCRAFNYEWKVQEKQAQMSLPNGPMETDFIKFTNNCHITDTWRDTKKCPDGFSAVGDDVWSTHENSNMNGLLSSGASSRCPYRYADLASAKAACKRNAECFGVTKDNGLCGGKRFELRGKGHNGSLSAWQGMTSYKKHFMPKAKPGLTCSGSVIYSIVQHPINSARMCFEKCALNPRCNVFVVEDAAHWQSGRMDMCNLYESCTTSPSSGGRSVPAVYHMEDHDGVTCRQDESNVEASWAYKGCYVNQAANRVTGHVNEMTWSDCRREAVKRNISIFGMEWPQGNQRTGAAQCLLLDSASKYTAMQRVADSECEAEGLHEGKRLGSAHRLAVYQGAFEFKLSPTGAEDKTYLLDATMATTRGIWGVGVNEEYDVEIWRHTGDWNNAAYTGVGKWLPIAQGKFRYTKVGYSVRADPVGELYTFLGQDGKDTGELRLSATVPGGFKMDDRVCAIPALSSSAAARAAEKRLGVDENQGGRRRMDEMPAPTSRGTQMRRLKL